MWLSHTFIFLSHHFIATVCKLMFELLSVTYIKDLQNWPRQPTHPWYFIFCFVQLNAIFFFNFMEWVNYVTFSVQFKTYLLWTGFSILPSTEFCFPLCFIGTSKLEPYQTLRLCVFVSLFSSKRRIHQGQRLFLNLFSFNYCHWSST